jgi:site-specific DNA-methyltransferase (adenine-specific)
MLETILLLAKLITKFVSKNKSQMRYTIQEFQEKFSLVSEDIEQFVKSNDIQVGKDGALSNKAYQALLNFYSEETTQTKSDKAVCVLNGHKIQVNQKPFFESLDKRISIFQDDAISFLKGLPANSIDIIITDPAYSGMNQRLKLGSGKIIGKYSDAGKNGAKWFEEFHDTEENYKAFLKECFRVLKNNRHIYIMFDSFSLLSLAPIAREVFEVKNVLCWDKANIGLGHYFRRRHEFILFASKGKRQLNSKSIPDVWKIKRITSSQYPTQKPTEVFELMLKGSAEKDFVVCDPFLGSGSSAIAAIKFGCKFLGCDISDKSVSVSMERVKQFLKTKTDMYQKSSHLGDDEAMTKLFLNGKSK